MADEPETWTCTVCYDAFPSTDKYCKIQHEKEEYHYRACVTCLRTQFLSAQKNEINYPVKWQKQILHPRQFPGAFNRTFVRAYEAKEVEYNSPPLERVYCECGTFVAPMVDANARASWLTLASSKLCQGCEARWCLRCAQRCRGFGVPHDCEPEKRLGERRLAFGGLKKGKDFQVCPGQGCGRTIELAEACNAMTCQCGTSFCYICGERAEPESEHWLRVDGGCPRYGAVDSERAMYDDDFNDADDNANANVPANQMEIWEPGQAVGQAVRTSKLDRDTAERVGDIEEYASRRKPDVDNSDVVPRTQTPTPARERSAAAFRIDGNAAATLSCNILTVCPPVVVTEPGISPPQHPDIFHAPSSSAVREIS